MTKKQFFKEAEKKILKSNFNSAADVFNARPFTGGPFKDGLTVREVLEEAFKTKGAIAAFKMLGKILNAMTGAFQ